MIHVTKKITYIVNYHLKRNIYQLLDIIIDLL